MAPNEPAFVEMHNSVKASRAAANSEDDEIVISGMSGRFPKSRNVSEFEHNLYNKVDMVSNANIRWKQINAKIPVRAGKVSDTNKFDATFFGVHSKLAHCMDPISRILLEVAYEAILDAGVNPKSLRDSNTGVYIGTSGSDSEKALLYDNSSTGGVGIMGCSRAMLANRISFTLGFHGPSITLDTACSSSIYALDCAYSAMRNGEIDAAIVGGGHLNLHPNMTQHFVKLGVLAPDGFCRPFDEAASGYTRSESINCIFLQRRRDCKRIYATVVHCKTNNDGFKAEGILYPSRVIITKLFKEFYSEVGIDPKVLSYVEAHSTGTVIGDPEECAAIDAVLCKDRSEPLLIGSVKSSIGHTESASGVCGIVKGLLALEKGKVAPNLHFSKPRKTIAALLEGRIKVATEIEELRTPFIGINGFGFGGSNAHILLKGCAKEKLNNGMPFDALPRLVLWSGRNEESINDMLNAIQTKPLDVEFVALINNTQKETTPGFVFRGFGLFSQLHDSNAVCIAKDFQHFNGSQRPIVWVFSGMGSQWTSMGASLMGIPIFSAAINRCHNALKPKGLDLINIITSTDESIFDNILHSFVGIAAVQIGIVDVLQALDLEPNYIIGHSLGELGCAYADGAFTAEQMILASYSRGKVSLDMDKIRGSMAAVGLGYQAIVDILPPKIEVACHNSAESSTISGPTEDVEKFVTELKQKGIFAKEVPCSNIAYHSRYVANMGPQLLKHLQDIIPNPAKRSSKWLSSSVPKHQWGQPQNELCSAEYHTNNVLSSVLFEETTAMLPQNAICIEIAPHGLLQAILRRSMPNAIHIPLTQRKSKNNTNFFLSALGKMYTHGLNLPIERLYPMVDFPVSRQTSLISPLVRWDHSDDWFVANYDSNTDEMSGEKTFNLNLKNEEHAFIAGHLIDGKVLVPATYYLQMVWETYSLLQGRSFFVEVPVEFTDVHFIRATHLIADKPVTLVVTVHRGSGDFEICESSATVVKGNIAQIINPRPPSRVQQPLSHDITLLETRDFYKELRLRGYHYVQLFKGVTQARSDGLGGKVQWADNWVTFMDTLLQFQIVGKDSRSLMLPTRLEKLRIAAPHHLKLVAQMESEEKFFDVTIDPYTRRLVAGGIEFIGIHATAVPRRKPPGVPVLESYQFIPHLPAPTTEIREAIRMCVQTALEENMASKMKVVEIDQRNVASVITFFQEALEDLPVVSGDLLLLSSRQLDLPGVLIEDGKLSTHNNCMFIVSSNLLGSPELLADIDQSLAENGYIVSIESSLLKYDELQVPPGFSMLAFVPTDIGSVVLMRRAQVDTATPTVIRVSQNDTSYRWLAQVQSAVETGPVLLVAEKEKFNGLIGMVNCLRKEPGGIAVKCVFVDDSQAPTFELEHPFYADRLKLGLSINVFRNGKWGFYRHLKLLPEIISAQENATAYAKILQVGDLSSLVWTETPKLGEDDYITVIYASLNFRDIMEATGRLPIEVPRLRGECGFGYEFSGIGTDGQRCMGLKITGCMATHIEKPRLLWTIPDTWSLAEAASVPCVYVTVYVAFFQTCDIRHGKSILIHAGSGGVGQAAISVALAYGLEVFTTVSTEEKKQYLLKRFPQLKETHIGNSRDTSFEHMIAEQTQGVGVDFVLNSLVEDKLLASVRCLARKGHFLEIGKFDMLNNNKIGLAAFTREISFHTVMIDQLFISNESEIQAAIKLVSEGIRDGVVKPIPTTIFKPNEIEQAFRFMAAGKHMGKVIISIHDENEEQHKLVGPITLLQRLHFNPDLVYVIPGGLGGVGLELADWLILRNARKIVLSSRKGVSKTYQQYRIELWKSYGAQVHISTEDITTYEGCQALLSFAMKLGPVGGIFNLAVLLRDAVFANQTPDTFRECLAPKAFATKFLDEISRKVCPQLEHFVVFSSVSCGRGNAGQTNYGMANSVMERIMEQRARDGLPAKAVQWGAVGEVGIVAELAEDKIDMEIGGTLLQRISSCLQELDNLLSTTEPIVSSMVVADKRNIQGGDIMEVVMNIIGIRDITSISVDTTLTEAGMDSMATVEIKQTLEREFAVFLSPQELRTMTFQRLQEISNSNGKEPVEEVNSLQDNTPFGIGLLLRNLGDEQNCHKVILPLATKMDSSNAISASLVIPGIEGVAGQVWHTLARGLQSPTNILQLMTTTKMSSVQAINDSIFKRVLQSLNKSDPFYLIGYSFGSLVTLDLAYRLEQLGFQGKVALIDGAPKLMQQTLTWNSGSTTSEKNLQTQFFTAITVRLLPDEPVERVSGEYLELPDWNSRVTKFMEYMSTVEIYSNQYLETLGQAIYQRLQIIREMSVEDFRPIQSPIVLIRPRQVSVRDIAEDYELSKCTLGKVVIDFVEGDHATMLDNPELVKILNSFDPNLLPRQISNELSS